MKRRSYLKTVGAGMVAIQMAPGILKGASQKPSLIRLGGPVFDSFEGPDGWIKSLQKLGYRAAYCPVKPGEDEKVIRAYELAAQKNDIIIAEVGTWSNPISPRQDEADHAIQKCIDGLQLADQIGARCCVNVSGSKNPDFWAGLGNLNYGIYFKELVKLVDVPLMMEHLETAEEYKLAADYIRSVARLAKLTQE